MQGRSTPRLSNWRTLLGFAPIFSVTVLFHFAALGHIPPGVFSDEALNGNEGIHAQRTGDYKIFYPTNNGREGLWINLIGLSESIFGVNQFGLRFPSAVVGSLTVLAVFLLARELFSLRTALFSAWFLAVAFWHVAFSRIALRGILVPLLLTVSVLLLVQAIRIASEGGGTLPSILAALGGLVYGLGFYSYIAYRFTPFVILAFFAIDLDGRRRRREPLKPWIRIFTIWWLRPCLLLCRSFCTFSVIRPTFSPEPTSYLFSPDPTRWSRCVRDCLTRWRSSTSQVTAGGWSTLAVPRF